MTEQPAQPEDTDDSLNDGDDASANTSTTATGPSTGTAGVTSSAIARCPWPPSLPEQMRAVADTLAASPGPLGEAALADRFAGRGPWKKRLPQILQTLEALGCARADAGAGGLLWRAA